MSNYVNKVILIGNVGQDPVIKKINEKEMASFTLATTESWKDKRTGEKKEKTEWHKVVVYNENLAKLIADYVKKGSKLYIEGAIQTRKWAGDDMVEKTITEIVLQNYSGEIVLLDSSTKRKAAFAINEERINQDLEFTSNDDF
jgi:single-strand DNA-binding protein